MGTLRFGPARVLSRESPDEAIELLRERGYTANEIDFESGFWMDYPWAEEFGKLARKRRIALSVHAPIAGFMGHVERDRKHGMATGMLDHSAGIAKVAGAEPVVFHPGFLLGRTRKQTVASVVSQLGDFRKRIEAKDRGVAFGIEIMGRVNDFGSLDDILGISSRLGWVRPVIDFAHLHATSDGAFTTVKAFPRRARRRQPHPSARRAVPHPLLGHRLCEPQRDEAPSLRRGHAARRAAREGARPLHAPRDRDQRGAGRGVTSGDSRGALLRGGHELAETLLDPLGLVVAPAIAQELSVRPEHFVLDLAELRVGDRGEASANSSSASSSRPWAARTIASDAAVVAREVTSSGPTVSRASSANRSASSTRPRASSSSASPRWLSHSVARSPIGFSSRIDSRKRFSAFSMSPLSHATQAAML